MRKIIETDRLVLRPLALDDAPEFARLANDYDIAKMTGSFPHPFPQLSVEFKIMSLRAGRKSGQHYCYAITLNGAFIGVASLHHSNRFGGYEVAYWVGKPYWGKGYASEAAAAVIKAGEEDLNLDVIYAGAFADNPASDTVLKKLGFKRTGPDRYFSMARLKMAPGFLYARRSPLASVA